MALQVLAERLKQLRIDSNKSQKDIMIDLDIKQTTLSGYENGTREPDILTLSRLAKYYGVTTDYLVGNSDFKTHAEETIPIAPEIIDVFINIITKMYPGNKTHPREFYILESRRIFAPLITNKYFELFSMLISSCRWTPDELIEEYKEKEFEKNKFFIIESIIKGELDPKLKGILETALNAKTKLKINAVKYHQEQIEETLKLILEDIKAQRESDAQAGDGITQAGDGS